MFLIICHLYRYHIKSKLCLCLGYYCAEGTVTKEPATAFCPVGHYCPEGVSQAIPCRNNTAVCYYYDLFITSIDHGFDVSPIKRAAIRRKRKDWLIRNWDNVSKWSDMSISGLLFQCTSTTWSSWKIADLVLNNNHSLVTLI